MQEGQAQRAVGGVEEGESQELRRDMTALMFEMVQIFCSFSNVRQLCHWRRRIDTHTATHCNTLQHTATHCNMLQHAATCCNMLQHAATHRNTLQHTATCCNTLQHTATHCNTLQHTGTHCIVSNIKQPCNRYIGNPQVPSFIPKTR